MGSTLKGKYAVFTGYGEKILVRCVSNETAGSCYFVDEFGGKRIDFVEELEFLPDELRGESWETVKLYLAL